MNGRLSDLPRPRAAFGRAALLTIILMVTVLACVLPADSGNAASATAPRGSREYLIKAAFVYDLMKATAWPRPASSRAVLCVRGRDAFGSAWNSIQDKPMGSRRLHVRHLQPSASTAGCDALFLGNSERQWWLATRTTFGKQPILTVSEMTGFSKDGGMVGMMNVDNRLRFDVNLQAVRAAGLSINTDALEMANMIHAGTARAGQP